MKVVLGNPRAHDIIEWELKCTVEAGFSEDHGPRMAAAGDRAPASSRHNYLLDKDAKI